jgi:hypothetical protein
MQSAALGEDLYRELRGEQGLQRGEFGWLKGLWCDWRRQIWLTL